MDELRNPVDLVGEFFDTGGGAFNISRGSGRWQVSTRDNATDGWTIYFGVDLAEVIRRAASKGPQLPPSEPVCVEFLL